MSNIGNSDSIGEVENTSEKGLHPISKTKDRSITSFIDYKMRKSEGSQRTCLQDSMINAASIFGIDIKDQLYKEAPPYAMCNSAWNQIMKGPCVSK